MAVFVILPCASCAGVTTIIAVATWPTATLPILQTTVAPVVKLQAELDKLAAKVTRLGNVSVIVTWVACDGPLFVTVSM